MSKMQSIQEWRDKYLAIERDEVARMVAYRNLTREQRATAITHLREMQPGRTNVFWASEILDAHLSRGTK